GYSIVFCSGVDKTSTGSDYIPSFYPISLFPIQQNVAFVTHLVQYQLSRGVHIAAIEVMNEPNNAFAAAEGSNWETQLVNLSNAVADAIHGLNANIQVIGLGGQGQQILDMLALAPTHLDGIVYHPYDAGGTFDNPEAVFEGGTQSNPYLGFSYVAWVNKLRSVTTLPLWETECGSDAAGCGGWGGESMAAQWMTRRLVLTKILNVEHTF